MKLIGKLRTNEHSKVLEIDESLNDELREEIEGDQIFLFEQYFVNAEKLLLWISDGEDKYFSNELLLKKEDLLFQAVCRRLEDGFEFIFLEIKKEIPSRSERKTLYWDKLIENFLSGVVILTKSGVIIESTNSIGSLLKLKSETGVFLKKVEIIQHSIVNLFPSVILNGIDSFWQDYDLRGEKSHKSIVTLGERTLEFKIFLCDIGEKELYIGLVFSDISELQKQNESNKFLVRLICHDIAAPLTIIKHYLERIIKYFEKEGISKNNIYTDKMKLALGNTLGILKNVRDMAVSKDNKLSVKSDFVSLSSAVKESLLLVEARAEAKRVIFEVDGIGDDIFVYVDRNIFINQILVNVLSNAIKFSEADETIFITFKEDKKNILLSVCDLGVGVPKSLIGKLFDPSAQTTRKGTAGESGTGYGLPLVKTFIENFNGSINVESHCVEEFPNDHWTDVNLIFPKIKKR